MNKCIAAYPKTIIITVASKAFRSDLLNTKLVPPQHLQQNDLDNLL
jgi:hypothetical protein